MLTNAWLLCKSDIGFPSTQQGVHKLIDKLLPCLSGNLNHFHSTLVQEWFLKWHMTFFGCISLLLSLIRQQRQREGAEPLKLLLYKVNTLYEWSSWVPAAEPQHFLVFLMSLHFPSISVVLHQYKTLHPICLHSLFALDHSGPLWVHVTEEDGGTVFFFGRDCSIILFQRRYQRHLIRCTWLQISKVFKVFPTHAGDLVYALQAPWWAR